MNPEIKNLKKAADRILKAIKKQENIILYSDADLDGAASVIVLKESIRNLGGEISDIYFPDREKEGYGLNEKALSFLSQFSPALFIVLDCGIGNFKEVKLAKKLGFEVIIIDHHEILEKLPEASIVVDPKQKGDNYPFKGLATAGIVFRLSELLLKKQMTKNLRTLPSARTLKTSPILRKNFLELVSLATIADMMPREEENKMMIEEGLRSLRSSFRPGIQAFLETKSIKNYESIQQAAQKIISVLNIRDTQGGLPASYRFLTATSLEEAENLIENLLEKSLQRREKINKMVEEVEEKIFKKIENLIIFAGEPSWELTLLSSVASIICNQYKKPTFLYKIEETKSQGAVRMPKGFNGVKAMMSCSQLLETYGGHPLAAGFRIKNENLERFKECLINYFSQL